MALIDCIPQLSHNFGRDCLIGSMITPPGTLGLYADDTLPLTPLLFLNYAAWRLNLMEKMHTVGNHILRILSMVN